MEEKQVTVDGNSHPLPTPFFVIATENNIEYQGTYPLPEGQLDRFMIRLSLGYPDCSEESLILDSQAVEHPLACARQVVSAEELQSLQSAVKSIFLESSLRDYIVELVTATRTHKSVALGASPRGSINLSHASRSLALLSGREYVLPDDIKMLAVPVLAHRLILKPEARMHRLRQEDVVTELLSTIPVPAS